MESLKFFTNNIFIMKNLTDFRKTVETGMDPRLKSGKVLKAGFNNSTFWDDLAYWIIPTVITWRAASQNLGICTEENVGFVFWLFSLCMGVCFRRNPSREDHHWWSHDLIDELSDDRIAMLIKFDNVSSCNDGKETCQKKC